MGRTGLRICDRCRALESVGDAFDRPCKICGFPGPDLRATRDADPIAAPPQ
jgi:hypothetical protein